MRFVETVRSALRSLAGNRLRTALTMLGMVIGVAAVVAVLGMGSGAQASVETRIRALGSNLLSVSPGSAQSGAVRTGSVETLTRADADAIARLPNARTVAPQASTMAQLSAASHNANAEVLGVTEAYFSARSIDLASGIAIDAESDRTRARMAVLGSSLAKKLFPSGQAIGARVHVRGLSFRVVGVLVEKGSGFASPDDKAFVPLATLQGSLTGKKSLSTVDVAVASEAESPSLKLQLTRLLRLRHGLADGAASDFEVRSQAEILETMSSITGTFTALLGSVAAVSLLVGGIGIMNIMLVSVRERTREIGVRIAVGARRRDVLLQFLVEAVAVSLVGGAAGLAVGYGAAAIIARFGGWATTVPVYASGLALGVSVAIGVVFGVGPARRAARLDPVEALRQE